ETVPRVRHSLSGRVPGRSDHHRKPEWRHDRVPPGDATDRRRPNHRPERHDHSGDSRAALQLRRAPRPEGDPRDHRI
ncbi:MAG: hypothetical protein AVDCRST_MAG42-2638, partial [uncultured Chthoniobacterales bacterium]